MELIAVLVMALYGAGLYRVWKVSAPPPRCEPPVEDEVSTKTSVVASEEMARCLFEDLDSEERDG